MAKKEEQPYGYRNIDVKYGIQIIFSTIPNQANIDFEKDIEDNYFKSYKKSINSTDDYLYKPIKFFLLGDYDVCYISLINNFKFSHRLFEPKPSTIDSVTSIYNAHTFQSFSGFALNDEKTLENLFSNPPTNYFGTVINLKLNNGLLIGNGLQYVEAVANELNNILDKIPYVLTQTFSWFELSLVIFINAPSELAEIITKIRLAEFSQLINYKDLMNSLYNAYYKNEEQKIFETSLFSDTHSYFGFNTKLISEPIDNTYVAEFLKLNLEKEIELKTEIEWQVKPGHIKGLEELILNDNTLKSYFNSSNRQLVLGKCDYLLHENNNGILSNFYLIRHMHDKNNCKLFNHVRKVRSYVFLDVGDNIIKQSAVQTPLSWEPIFNKLAVTVSKFLKIDTQLKSLKVSRQIRIKVLKIFSNYNNGIQDPILFPYFLDFTIFIRNLIKLIEFEYENADRYSFKLSDLEKKLNEHIKIFQEGYNVRFLNGYQFENISDFDLDFNSSIQQLLTSYGSLVYEIGKSFYKMESFYPIIQLNNTDTVSNNLSINYSIQHLTSPELVFSTLLKEILNQVLHDQDQFKGFINDFYTEFKNQKQQINESYLDELFESKRIDMNYFIIDAVRFIITFNADFKSFEHWFWTYNFQNSSLYDSSGMFNEDYLKMEILRILMVKKFYNISPKDKLDCPIPEIDIYWARHYNKIDFVIDKITGLMSDKKINVIIKYIVEKYLSSYANTDLKESSILFKYLSYIDILGISMNDLQSKKLSFLFDNKVSDVKVHNMEKLMFNALDYLSENNKIVLLKRDWLDGKVLKNHHELYKDLQYAIDQTGGVYFYDINKMNNYFQYNAKCLLSIIDFSYKQKKEFIINIPNETN